MVGQLLGQNIAQQATMFQVNVHDLERHVLSGERLYSDLAFDAA
jgi:hypothetical protein